MSKLISNEEQLRAHLPNVIAFAKGETPLYDKVEVFLDLAEEWVKNTFTSESTFNTICGYSAANETRHAAARLVVAEAMRRAIPSLDVVLTPNGFAVVQTQNLAPASKPRIDRLVASMLNHRDDCIAALLPLLPGAAKWLNSSQSAFFGSTLFPTLDICDAVGGAQGSKWDKYLELRPQIFDLECSLAEEYLSPELMELLRDHNLRSTATAAEATLISAIKAQIVGYLKTGTFNARRLGDIVNYIRTRPDDFPLWHGSATAQLFTPPLFINTKNSTGYFF